MGKATLYIIQGFIASGKTTFSKKLAIETNSLHLNPDEWVTKRYEKEYYMNNWNKCFDETLLYLWDETKRLLNNGKNVIFDMGFWKKEDREYARKIAKECNGECIHYYLYVPNKILKKRIMESRSQEWAAIHLKNFESNMSKFEQPNNEDVIIVNNY